jgi:hypothetical protein
LISPAVRFLSRNTYQPLYDPAVRKKEYSTAGAGKMSQKSNVRKKLKIQSECKDLVV